MKVVRTATWEKEGPEGLFFIKPLRHMYLWCFCLSRGGLFETSAYPKAQETIQHFMTDISKLKGSKSFH